MLVTLVAGVVWVAVDSSHRNPPKPAEPTVSFPTCGEAVGVDELVTAADGNTEYVTGFLGVPFAAPPVGSRRWLPAKPLAPSHCWSGQLDARSPGPKCMQDPDGPVDPVKGPESEDCLSLSVFVRSSTLNEHRSAADAAAARPVVVFLHGGSLVSGSDTSYGSIQRLLVHMDVVLVVPQYRLGPLGWVVLPELIGQQGDGRGTAGNYGLTDQIEALKWVQANAAAVGGNPEAVTILGHSSGGTSVLGLMVSPAASGLFQGAISSSGSPNITMDLASAAKQGEAEFLPRTPCAAEPAGAERLACLRGMSAADVTRAMPPKWDDAFEDTLLPPERTAAGWNYSGLMVVDGHTLPVPLLDGLADPGVVQQVPVLVSSMAEEPDLTPQVGIAAMNLSEFWAYERTFGDEYDPAFLDQLQNLYGAAPDALSAFNRIQSDLMIGRGSNMVARAAALGLQGAACDSFLAMIEYQPNRTTGVPDVPGTTLNLTQAYHLWDVMRAFGTDDAFERYGAPPYVPTRIDLAAGAAVRSMWWDVIQQASGQGSTGALLPLRPPGQNVTNVLRRATGNLVHVLQFRQAQYSLFAEYEPSQAYWWSN